MTERFEIFPQNVAKDGTLIIIQKGLKLYNISDVVDLLNELNEENKTLQKQKQELLKNYAEISTALELTIKEKNNILHTIQETYETERTSLGKSVIKQLLEQIQ